MHLNFELAYYSMMLKDCLNSLTGWDYLRIDLPMVLAFSHQRRLHVYLIGRVMQLVC